MFKLLEEQDNEIKELKKDLSTERNNIQGLKNHRNALQLRNNELERAVGNIK
tara:strand:+ start:332 stop:487 length:156 start_codon:yes stop_codon:yes gene_type:complete